MEIDRVDDAVEEDIPDIPEVVDDDVEEEDDPELNALFQEPLVEVTFDPFALFENNTLSVACCTPSKRAIRANGALNSPVFCLLANYLLHHGCKSEVEDTDLALALLYFKRSQFKDAAAAQPAQDFDQEAYNYAIEQLDAAEKKVEKEWLVMLQDDQGHVRAWSAGKCIAYIVVEALATVGLNSAVSLVANCAMALARSRVDAASFFPSQATPAVTKLFGTVEQLNKAFK